MLKIIKYWQFLRQDHGTVRLWRKVLYPSHFNGWFTQPRAKSYYRCPVCGWISYSTADYIAGYCDYCNQHQPTRNHRGTWPGTAHTPTHKRSKWKRKIDVKGPEMGRNTSDE